ncbi:MAG: flagella accessory protein C [Methanomassiliicoccales archaeon]
MKRRAAPLPSSFVFLAAFPFRKHKKAGGEDLSAKLDVEELGLGEDEDTLSIGELGTIGGKLGRGDEILSGLTTKNEKIDQLEGTVNELKNQVETIGNTSTSIKGQVESMRKEIESINDSIKNLLGVYEAVSRQYNPFVDQAAPKVPSFKEETVPQTVTKLDKEMGIPIVDEEGEIQMARDLNAPLDKVLKFDDNSSIAANLDINVEEIDKEVGEKAKIKQSEKASMISEATPLQQDAPLISKSNKKIRIDSYALRQIYKLVDYQLEKVYIAKSRGEEVPLEELEMLEHWMQELMMVGVK